MENTLKLPLWYSKDRTIPEMCELSEKSYKTVHMFLIYHGLPFKYAKIQPDPKYKNKLPSWYNSESTVAEMATKAGVSTQTIRYHLRRNKLPYKSGFKYEQGVTVSSCKVRVDELDKYIKYPDWYSPELTPQEMADKSEFTTDMIKTALIVFKLEHK